jgi:hypothetical protein
MQASLQKALNMVQSKKLTIFQMKTQVELHLKSATDNDVNKSICQVMHSDLDATHVKLLETEGDLTRLLIGSDEDKVKMEFLQELVPMLEKLKMFSYLLPVMPG